jgi:hypothetical protein
MTTLQKQTSLFTEEQLTYSQVDFRANLIPLQEKGKAKRMSATYGLKCLEQFEKFNRATLWGKMLLGLLVGMEGWYSTRCKLTWKMKGTKYGRLYFQLQASTLPIKEKGCGLLLKTPSAMDAYSENLSKKEQKLGNSGTLAQEVATGFIYQRGLLPTPRANEVNGCNLENNANLANRNKGNLEEVIAKIMLPTPAIRDYKGARSSEALEAAGGNETNSLPDFFSQPGTSSQLNPQFVAEMMGFPSDWTELPFLNGEPKA